MGNQKDENSWQEWNKLVIHQLDAHGDQFQIIQQQLTNIQVDIATLKVKSGLWGIMGGFVPVAIAMLVQAMNAKAAQ